MIWNFLENIKKGHNSPPEPASDKVAAGIDFAIRTYGETFNVIGVT